VLPSELDKITFTVGYQNEITKIDCKQIEH
jgi:hypothetical protein